MRYDRKDNRMTEHGYQTRTWEELKAETLARAERGVYPLFAISSDDARAAVDRFLGELLEAGDQAFVSTFNHEPRMVAGWTTPPGASSCRR